ncbi:hypothetical protein P3T23_007009 [Paraburkholderia sp. GAS448]
MISPVPVSSVIMTRTRISLWLAALGVQRMPVLCSVNPVN